MLTEKNYEIVTNKDGHEMLILPESEDESESCEEDFSNENVIDSEENFLNTSCQSEPVDSENWDIEWSHQPLTKIENLANDFLQSENTCMEQTDIPFADTIIPLSVKEEDSYSNRMLEHDYKEIFESCDTTCDNKLITILSTAPLHKETEYLKEKKVSNNVKTNSAKNKKSRKNISPRDNSKELLSICDNAAIIRENLSIACLNTSTECLDDKKTSDTKSSQSAKSNNYLGPEIDSKSLLVSHDKPHCTELTESLTAAFIKAETAFLEQTNKSSTSITQSTKNKIIAIHVRTENNSEELHAIIDKPHSELSEKLSIDSLNEKTGPLKQKSISDTCAPLLAGRKDNDMDLRPENDSKLSHPSYDKPDFSQFAENLTVAFLNAETQFLDQINKKNTSIPQSPKSKENDMKITSENIFEELPLSNVSDINLDLESKLFYSNDHSGSDMSLEDTQIDNVIVDYSLTYNNCASNNLSSDLLTPDSMEKNNKTNNFGNLECSVYETPFHDWLRSSSKSELYNPSAHSLYHNEHSPRGDCKKELRFESPSRTSENQPSIDSMVESPSCSTSVVPSLELSHYSTPCSNEIHNTRVPKSLSVQDLNGSCHSPLTVFEGGICHSSCAKKEKDKISKSMDGFRSQESCDIHDTCSNTSKVLDSGYPDSFSDHIMDSDSIKLDDIETESEGENLNSPLPSPVAPNEPPLLQRMIHNVENGDVANNNRDGEGNNMVADMEEEFFEFEAQIEEDIVPNDAAAFSRDCSYNCSQSDNSIQDSTSHIDASKYKLHNCSSPFKPAQNDILKNETTDEKSIKSAQSDTSISTISSWNYMKSSEIMPKIELEEIRQGDHSEVGRDNSLTTVLEGCSRFSDFSLVCPIETSSSNNEDGLGGYVFPKWMLSIDGSVFESEAKRANQSHHSLTVLRSSLSQGHLSSPSLYQSLNSSPVESDSEDANSDFPKWLLDVQVSDAEESNLASNLSNLSVLNSDLSMAGSESDEFDFDVQVDARGGGDTQREDWIN